MHGAAARTLRDLEPSVGRLLDRHLAVAREWFPHQYVPWSGARDFDRPLDGTGWSAQQSALPQAVQGVLLVNLLTDNYLPSYHFEIATRFGRDGDWGAWVHRWTAKEDRHACLMRAYRPRPSCDGPGGP
ncbi:acyl-ACP desaturase [Streptomyces chattanoogensis]|uniref:acyl-ACP desaturase n=1 Tax=Streptomyces chattanoogensis TaxID=66876 RepID=UPI003675CB6D